MHCNLSNIVLLNVAIIVGSLSHPELAYVLCLSDRNKPTVGWISHKPVDIQSAVTIGKTKTIIYFTSKY